MFTPEVMARMLRGAERTFLSRPILAPRPARAGAWQVRGHGAAVHRIAYLVRALPTGLSRMTARTRLPCCRT